MLRCVLGASAVWTVAVQALGAPAAPVVLVLGTVLVAGRLLPPRRAPSRHGARPLGPAAAMALLCGAAALVTAGFHSSAIRSDLWDTAAGSRVDAEVTLTADPSAARADRPPGAARPVLLEAETRRVTAPPGGAVTVRAPVVVVVETDRPDDWLALLPGTRLTLRADLAPPMPERREERAAILRVRDAGRPPVTASPGTAQRIAGRLRQGLRDATAALPGDAAALLPALVIGDDSRMPADLTDAVRATGLTHLVVASGSQVAIVLAVLVGRRTALAARAERGGIAARFGIPLRATAVVGCVLVAGFVLVCRPDPSVLRAALCAALTLLALGTGHRRSLLPALAAAVLLLILHDPLLSRSYGFLLSVLATGALLTVAPRWAEALRRRGVPERLATALAAAAAAQAACAPVITVFAPGTSLVAVPCNLLAQLAIAPVIVLGWAVILIAQLAPAAAPPAAWPAAWPARWIGWVARTGAGLPGAELAWPGGWSGAALLAVVTVAAVTLLRRLPRHPLPAAVCVLLLLLAVLRPAPLPRLITGWPPDGWRVVACDVGQGDALVLAAGGTSALVVDAGPEPAAVDACLRDLGVRHVPLLVLSHFHADHVGGVEGVLDGRRVDAIQAPPAAGEEEQAAAVRRVAREAGVPLREAVAGERHRIGEELSWEVLWPPPDAVTAGYGANDTSVTLLVRTGDLTVFLPGDLEPLAQERLLADHPDLPTVDVLKVAHHGSAHQDPALLDRLSPRIALISAGADNSYGHPAPSTLEALSDAGAVTARTDLHGHLAITGDTTDPRVIARHAP